MLESLINTEYSELVKDQNINIKISGCMNSCGQHMVSTIGFQGMSMKAKDKRILPAAQILIGGGILGDGSGRFGKKILKVFHYHI